MTEPWEVQIRQELNQCKALKDDIDRANCIFNLLYDIRGKQRQSCIYEHLHQGESIAPQHNDSVS